MLHIHRFHERLPGQVSALAVRAVIDGEFAIEDAGKQRLHAVLVRDGPTSRRKRDDRGGDVGGPGRRDRPKRLAYNAVGSGRSIADMQPLGDGRCPARG